MAVDKYDGGRMVFFNGLEPNDTTSFGPQDSRTNVRGWAIYGVYFGLADHPASNEKWWTFMISLWYPIIIFGILPAIFIVKKLRNRKSSSTKETTVEK
jgi:hypothetical protein